MKAFLSRFTHAAVNVVGAVLPFVLPGLKDYAAAHPSSVLAIALGANAVLHLIPDSASNPS